MLIISINFVTEYTQELARASIFGYSMSPGQKMFLYKKMKNYKFIRRRCRTKWRKNEKED